MAHTGTSVGLAKQPATGFGPMLLTAIIVLAIGVGVVAATWFLASPNRGVGVPTADHSYDQIESLRGAAIFSAAGDHSYDAIEMHARLAAPCSASHSRPSLPRLVTTGRRPSPRSRLRPASAGLLLATGEPGGARRHRRRGPEPSGPRFVPSRHPRLDYNPVMRSLPGPSTVLWAPCPTRRDAGSPPSRSLTSADRRPIRCTQSSRSVIQRGRTVWWQMPAMAFASR